MGTYKDGGLLDGLAFSAFDAREFSARDELRQSKQGRAYLMQQQRIRSDEAGSDVRPFVAWDGEGITFPGELEQAYVLFGSSLGLRKASRALSTRDCLDLIIATERECPYAIHVGFAFKYDTEMILRDLTRRHWEILHKKGSVRWQEFRLTYHPGKRLTVATGKGRERVTATIYDVFGFFQSSFVKALRGWLDASELAEIDRIEQGKDQRGVFKYSQLESLIIPYWESELRLLVALCDRLRLRLEQANILPKQWHGPGAVATVVYHKHGARDWISRTDHDKRLDKTGRDYALAELPKEVNEAARYAYAGGRFELFQLGHYDAPVYQYDINSAYPNAIAKLPNLARGYWEHVTSPTVDPSEFAVYEVEYDAFSPVGAVQPQPLFHRDERHCISYPMTVRGWYWTPEACIIAGHTGTRFISAWIYRHDGEQPFSFVREMYAERKALKAEGNPAERALKLALNSLYGKMAQRAGWEPGKALPRFHQLEWAGYVTSYTRAMLWGAMRAAGPNLLAVETDAVFTTKELPGLTIGGGLGEWDFTTYEWITYLSNGVYWTSDGKNKSRGTDAGTITHEDALTWLRNGDWSAPLTGYTTRFVGSGRGLRNSLPIWRSWLTEFYELHPGGSGKRIHNPHLCPACKRRGSLHRLSIASRGGDSVQHSLPWQGYDNGATEDGNPWRELVAVERWDGE